MMELDKVRKAAMLYLLSPCRDTESYQEVDMLKLVGIPEEFAKTSLYMQSFRSEYAALEQQVPRSMRQTDPKKQLAHFKEVDKLIPTVQLPKVLKLIGCKPEEIFKVGGSSKGGTNLYMNCRNARARREGKKNKTAATINIPPPTETIDTGLLSPVSETSELTDSTSSASDLNTITELSWVPPPSINRPLSSSSSSSTLKSLSTSDSSSSSVSNHPLIGPELPKLVLSSGRCGGSIEKYFTKKSHRRGTQEAHEKRQWEQSIRDVKTAAYKVGTTLFQTVKLNRNNLQKFKSAAACADCTNQLFGFADLVSGNQLIRAVEDDRVGKSPPRKGNPGLIPYEDVRDIADLVYTMCAIEQNNAGKRTDRSALVTLIGSMVDQKLKDDGKELVDTWQFYDRVQSINSLKQNPCQVNEREARRILWLTIQNAKSHYMKWEEFLVNEGFARKPTSVKEKHEKGFVVFKPNQLERIIIFDECQLSLNGSSDENAGGRTSMTHTTSALNEAGRPAHKSGDSVTLMLCAIGFEMVAPLVIYPSQAASKKKYKIPIENVESMQQVRGQYGFPAPRYHDPMFAISKKGGMNKEIFNDYINNHVLRLIPDRADIDGKRVVMKADMGPGRTSLEFHAGAYVTGARFFPGMPNSTEVMQEMDQLFGAFKSGLYKNRTALYEARLKGAGLTTQLSQADIGYLIFGGEITIPSTTPGEDPSTLVLPNPFETYLTKEHLQRAYEKCGYYPATRAPMSSEKMRYEIVERGLDIDPECDFDITESAVTQLLEHFENENHQAVKRLTDKGYKLASQGRRHVRRVTVEQYNAREAIRTEPNTRERQDALAKCKYSGDFFYVDGGVMTSADFLIGKERQQMGKRAIAMRREKNRYQKAASIEVQYNRLIESNKPKWNKDETIIAIKRHHGVGKPPQGETSFQKMSAARVKSLYNRKYSDKEVPPIEPWTAEMELLLCRLESGQIDSVQETAIYGKAVKKEEDYIFIRLNSVSESTRNRALIRLAETLDEECRERLIKALQGISTTSFEYGDETKDAEDEDYVPVEEEDEDDSIEDDSIEDDSIEDDSIEDDSTEDGSIEDNSIEGDNVVDLIPVVREGDTEDDGADVGNKSIDTASLLGSEGFSDDESSVDEPQPRYGLRTRKTSAKKTIDSPRSLAMKRETLLSKRDESAFEDEFESELKGASDDLEAALGRLSEGKKPVMKQLAALILSKGLMPPRKATKGALNELWNEVKDGDDWKRTVYFTPSDRKELASIEERLK